MTEQGMGETQDPGGPPSRPGGSRRLVLIALLVLIIVAVIVIAGIVPRERAKAALRNETNELAIPTVAVIQAKRGSLQQELVLPGNMQPFIESPIYARTNGYLKKWTHDIGAHVKTGELLAEIETPEVDAQLEQARSDLNTAIANMKLAQVTAGRYESLRNTDSVSKQDVDTAASDYTARKAMVSSAEGSVKRYEQLQSFEKVYAPFDGVITARHTDVGYLINSGNAGPAQELFRIAAIQKLRVFVNVPQQYSRDARVGLAADLTLPQFPERRFKGILVRTANSIDLASRTLLVELDVENPRGELLPGAYTEVHLKIPSNVPTFILPVTVLIFQAQGMQVAEVDNNHRAQLKPITIGRDFGAEVEIVAGLTGAEQIINNPPDSLVSGVEVRITPEGGGRNTP